MPVYDFECECGRKRTEFFKLKKVPKTLPCSKCKKDMKRVISSTNFILKGEGWAKDGYGNKK